MHPRTALVTVVLVAGVVVCVEFLAEAILSFHALDDQTRWLVRDVLDLGTTPKTENDHEARVWVAAVLVGAVLLILVLLAGFGRAAWIDVLAGLILVVAVYAALEARTDSRAKIAKRVQAAAAGPRPAPVPARGRAWFALPASKVSEPQSALKENAPVLVIAVKATLTDDRKTIERTAVSYGARLRAAVPAAAVKKPIGVGVAVEDAPAFAADLTAAETLYLLPDR